MAPGQPRGSKNVSNVVMWHFKLAGVISSTILLCGQTGDLGMRSKGQLP